MAFLWYILALQNDQIVGTKWVKNKVFSPFRSSQWNKIPNRALNWAKESAMRHWNKAAWALFALAMLNGCAATHGAAGGEVTYSAAGSPRQVPNLVVASAAAEALKDEDRAVYVATSRDGVTVSATPALGDYGLPMTGYGIVSGFDPREIESLYGTAAARQARYGSPALPPPQGRTPSTTTRTATGGFDPLVPCPMDRAPANTAELAACTANDLDVVTEQVFQP